MRRVRLFSFVLALTVTAAASAVGCGGSGSGHTPPSERQACKQATGLACEKLYGCPQTSMLLVALGGSEAACRTNLDRQVCGTSQYPLCGTPGRYQGAEAEICLDEASIVTCENAATVAAGVAGGQIDSNVVNALLAPCQMICGTTGTAATAATPAAPSIPSTVPTPTRR